VPVEHLEQFEPSNAHDAGNETDCHVNHVKRAELEQRN
jgi:hypothetical protein